MSEYLYVILDTEGRSWIVREQSTEKVALTSLLDQGWEPVRETPLHGVPYVLILLKRSDPAPKGG